MKYFLNMSYFVFEEPNQILWVTWLIRHLKDFCLYIQASLVHFFIIIWQQRRVYEPPYPPHPPHTHATWIRL